MRRKLIYGVLSLLLVVSSMFALTACGDKKDACGNVITDGVSDSIQDPSDIQIIKTTIRLYADGDDYAAELIKEFQKQYPQYIVKYSKVGAPDTRARIQLEQKDGADVFVMPHDHVGQALAQNLLQQASDATATKFDDTLKASTLDTIKSCWDNENNTQKQCSGDDARYTFGAPLSAESNALFYNVQLIKDILNNKDGILNEGFDYAAVSAEWQKWATDLTDTNLAEIMTLNDIVEVSKGYNVVGGDEARYFYQADLDNFYHSYMYMTPFGYELFGTSGDQAGLSNVASDAAKASLTWVKENFVDTKIYPGADGIVEGTYMEDFYSEEITSAIVVSGPWNAPSIYDAYKVEDADGNETYPNLGACAMPDIELDGTTVKETTFSGVLIAGVNKATSISSAAWTLVEFMVSDKGADILYAQAGKLPCLKDTSNIEGLSENKVLNAVSAQLVNSKGMPSISEMGYMWDIGATMFADLFIGKDVATVTAEALTNYRAQTKNENAN